jgi:hypothetical protein
MGILYNRLIDKSSVPLCHASRQRSGYCRLKVIPLISRSSNAELNMLDELKNHHCGEHFCDRTPVKKLFEFGFVQRLCLR